MFCQKCGKEIPENVRTCPNCGYTFNNQTERANEEDIPSGGMKFLSFILPIVGLILFIVWKNDFPNKSKAYGRAALWGFVIGTVGYFLLTMLGTCAALTY